MSIPLAPIPYSRLSGDGSSF